MKRRQTKIVDALVAGFLMVHGRTDSVWIIRSSWYDGEESFEAYFKCDIQAKNTPYDFLYEIKGNGAEDDVRMSKRCLRKWIKTDVLHFVIDALDALDACDENK